MFYLARGPLVFIAELFAGLILIAVIMLVVIQPGQASFAKDQDWQALYGDEVRFSIYRKQQNIGEYSLRFETSSNISTVYSQMNLAIKFLWLIDYTYQYKATEIWENGAMELLRVRVDDNGSVKTLDLARENNVLVGSGPNGVVRIAQPIMTTHHYNAAVVDQNRVLNTITGKENQVDIKLLGKEKIKLNQGDVDAFHYRYFGQLKDTDVWYDDHGRWVKLSFKGKDGVPVEFVCDTCQRAGVDTRFLSRVQNR